MAEKRKNNVGLNTLKPGEKGRIAGMALGKGIGEKLQDMGFLQEAWWNVHIEVLLVTLPLIL